MFLRHSRWFAFACPLLVAVAAEAQWLQWGGPNRDFVVKDADLADAWPENGPKVLWKRDLGDGYSCIVTDGKRLYTMYNTPGEKPADAGDADAKLFRKDVVIALDPETGKTEWEYKYDIRFDPEPAMLGDFGYGPRSTPLIIGNRIFTVGATTVMNCLDADTGEKIWSTDLRKDHGASTLQRGFGASPFAFEDKIILPIGGEGHAVIALKQSDGSLVWKNQDFGPSYASPFLHKIDGESHLIVFGDKAIHGLDPKTGESRWSHEHTGGANISTPVAGDDAIFFFSSAYGLGSRGIKVVKKDGKFTTEELFFNKKMKIHHGNAIRIGDYLYASSGDFGPAFLAAINVKTGKFGWKKRGITKANLIYADEKMIILDEDGRLYLARVSPEKIDVISKVTLLEKQAWTVPTLVGATLYLRDLKTIMAVDLGKTATAAR